MRPLAAPGTRLARRVGMLVVAVTILLTGAVRLRIADTPLERDEGEYAYAGRLILDGEPPYREAYNMKFPGTYYAYAAILAVFGSTPRGIRSGLFAVNATGILLLYLLGRRLVGEDAAVAAAVTFAVLTLDRWVMGVFAHATHFVTVAVLAGAWLLLRALERFRTWELAGAGALFGIAVLMKQHAAAFAPPAAAFVLWRSLADRPGDWRSALWRTGAFAAGASAPLALVVIVFAAQGVLGAFWFWTFRYARAYVTIVPASRFLARLAPALRKIVPMTAGFWILAGAGGVALWLGPWPKTTRVFLSGFLVAAFVAVCPGFYFRSHYFIVMLPAIALLAGVAVATVEAWLSRAGRPRLAMALGASLLLGAIGVYVGLEADYVFRMGPRRLSRERYGGNPFIEAVEIGRYIREHSAPGDRVAVLGSEPEIFFYARRRSATGYLYMYPLMEPHRFAPTMQDEMIRQVEQAQPAYLVYVQVGASWMTQPDSDGRLLRWVSRFVPACYDAVGVADIVSTEETVYVWEADVARYHPRSGSRVHLFRRKPGGPCRTGG